RIGEPIACRDARAEAEAIVRRGAPDAELMEQRSALMRYRGQGHEIAVPLPVRDFTAADRTTIRELFEGAYQRQYSRAIPGVEIEILSWVVSVSAPAQGRRPGASGHTPSEATPRSPGPFATRARGESAKVRVYWGPDLAPGARI